MLKFKFSFDVTLFCAFAFLPLLPLPFKQLYVFALNRKNSFMICPSNSSFVSPVTFKVFFLYVMVCLFQKLFQHLLQCLCKYYLFYINNEAVCIHNIKFSNFNIFWFYIIIPKFMQLQLQKTVLLRSNIDNCK